MIIKTICEHCQAVFDDDGLDKTVWCPACGKETHILPAGSIPQPRIQVESTEFDTAILLGYVFAIILPIIGFFVGLYLILKNQCGHGAATLAVSAFSFVLWFLLFWNLA